MLCDALSPTKRGVSMQTYTKLSIIFQLAPFYFIKSAIKESQIGDFSAL